MQFLERQYMGPFPTSTMCLWWLRQGGPKLRKTQVYPVRFAEKMYAMHFALKAGMVSCQLTTLESTMATN